jgi:hypothetical protein
MFRTRRRRPQLETLETMTLLSGAGAAMGLSGPAATRGQVAAEVGPVINLPLIPVGASPLFPRGTIRGLYVRQGGSSTIQFSASGSLSPLGATTETGTIGATGTVLIATPKGTVTLQLFPATTPGHFNYGYGITETTGAYAGDQGAGTVDVTLGPRNAGKVGISFGSIRLTFGVYPTPIF